MENEGPEPGFWDELESHLENDQFRRRVMLFQRSDNVLLPLLNNLEEIKPTTDEELTLYEAFLTAAELILAEMVPFLPPKTHASLSGRLAVFRSKMKSQMRQSVQNLDLE